MIIQDQTGTLTSGQIESLQSVGYSFNPKIIILSKSPSNLSDYVHSFQLQGDDLVMVVDFPGHQVRTVAGPSLTDKGVNNTFLKQMQNQVFVPQMRKKNLEGAISDSMGYVQKQVESVSQPQQVVTQPQPVQVPIIVTPQQSVETHVDFNPLLGGMLFIGIVAVIAVFLYNKFSNNFRLEETEDLFNDEYQKIVNLSPDLEAITEANSWFIQSKKLNDDYQAFKVSHKDTADKLVTITRLYDKARNLVTEGKNIRSRNKASTSYVTKKIPPSGGSNVQPPKKEKKFDGTPQSITNVNYNSSNYNDTYTSPSTYSTGSSSSSSRKSSSSSSDSGSSSSSSSSNSSNSDSGSSSWDSSSSSSSDSGSSSWGGDSGGCSDGGSSGW